MAGAVIHHERVLLVRHTYSEKEERWALPSGFAAYNERLEEAKLYTKVTDLIGLVTRYMEREGSVFVVFRLHPLAGQPVLDRMDVDRLGWFAAEEEAAMYAEELWLDIHNPALGALVGSDGVAEDRWYPRRSETARGFLLRVDFGAMGGERQSSRYK